MAEKKKKVRRSTEDKAKMLAEISSTNTVEMVAKKHGVHPSQLYKWRSEAGLSPKGKRKPGRGRAGKRKPRSREFHSMPNTPTPKMQRALHILGRGKRTRKDIAQQFGISASTLKRWGNHYGTAGPMNGTTKANGSPARARARANGASTANPLVELSEARAQLSAIIEQIDALPLGTLRSLFGA